MHDAVSLPDGWIPVDVASVHLLTVELQAELCPAHVLKNVPLRIVAKHLRRDDILAQLDDGRVAKIHLTWNLHPEPDPFFPHTVLFSSMTAFASGTS